MYEVFFEQNKKTRTHYADTETPKGEQYLSAKKMMFRAYVICTSLKLEGLDIKSPMYASNEAGWHFMLHLFDFQNPIIFIGLNIIAYIFYFVNTLMNIFLKSGYNI